MAGYGKGKSGMPSWVAEVAAEMTDEEVQEARQANEQYNKAYFDAEEARLRRIAEEQEAAERRYKRAQFFSGVKEQLELPIYVLLFVAGVASISFGAVWLNMMINRTECERYASLSRITAHYDMFTGCLVQSQDKRWVGLQQYQSTITINTEK